MLTSLEGFKDRYGIDDGQVTLVVLGVCLMAAVGTVVADRVARSAGGSRIVLGAGLLIVATAVVIAAVAPVFAVLALGFAVYGVGLGMVDAGTNMQAVAIQREYGRSLLTGFYASWSVGGIAGAVFVAATVGRTPTDPVAVALLAGTLVALLAAVGVLRAGWRVTVPVHADGVATPDEALALPVRVAASPSSRGGPSSCSGSAWSRSTSPTPRSPPGARSTSATSSLAAASFAPLGYAAYLTTTLASRLAGDPLVRRWGRVVVLRTGRARRRRRARARRRGTRTVGRPGRVRGRRCRASASSRPCASPPPGTSRPGTRTRSWRGSTSSTTSERCSAACWWAPSAAPRRCTTGSSSPIVLVVVVAVLAGRFGVTRHTAAPVTAGAGA